MGLTCLIRLPLEEIRYSPLRCWWSRSVTTDYGLEALLRSVGEADLV